MSRKIHEIYDVILKIIIAVYGTIFLSFMGIDGEIKDVLSVEITTLTGSKMYLDFLCLLKDGGLCHIEFQHPHAGPDDFDRFFNYNISSEFVHQKRSETYIFNFDFEKAKSKIRRIGKTKCSKPIQFFLGDVDFDEYLKNINIKVKSDKTLAGFEEIALMLMPVSPKFEGNAEVLKWISNILLKKELFDETKYEFVQAVVGLEIENFLSEDEQKEIAEEIKMTPRAQHVVTQAIREVNQKVLAETEQKGIEKGIEQGRAETREEVARNLKGDVDIGKLSAATGLSVDEINRL